MRKILRQFLQLESSSGIILFSAALLSMLWANSPLSYLHRAFTETLLFTINDGLMVLFFLMVGLELKRGFLEGPLSQPSQVILPAVAALGGMVMPACIYWMFNAGNDLAIRGWSTPVATDIAFALGVLMLFGRRVPASLKLFLLALAIFDDIGAILIIAIFYSHGFSYIYFIMAVILTLTLYLFNALSLRYLTLYLLVGVGLWVCLLYSGIHPTIAGVLLALAIPAGSNHKTSLLHRLENALGPYVAYCIMPLFALANAGFAMQALPEHALTSTVVLGIVAGLFVGKQLGVFGFSWLLIRWGGIRLPEQTSWLALYGVSLLCGIGFTMSLFLGTLSFQNAGVIYLAEVRMGVILGSMLSGMMGLLVLYAAFRSKRTTGISRGKRR